MCGSEEEQHGGWSMCFEMELRGHGDLQDNIQAASWDMDWIIEPMLRKNL